MNIIKLANSFYEVKVVDGIRMVKAGQWMEATKFVDWLSDNNKTSELVDLIKLVINTIKSK
jgi:hypothetical protein